MPKPSQHQPAPVTRKFVAYPARLIHEGQDTRISFPDCPGCETVAGADEDVLEIAQEALTGWLEVRLEEGAVPPQPSAIVQRSATGQILMVPVPDDLTRRLEDRWNT
ncbi:MAG: type II toxin-antitoxin system HicB family antitoxin [Gemmatimonadales bacterium]